MTTIEKKAKRYPNDEEWGAVRPLPPQPSGRGRKRMADSREMVERLALHGAVGLRGVNAAGSIPAVADGPLVVPAFRAVPAVSHHP